MSAALTEIVVEREREKNKQARWWRRNACAKHGIQFEDDTDPAHVEITHKHTHTGISQPLPQPSPQQPALAGTPGGLSSMAKLALAGALGAGAVGLPAAYFLSGDKETEKVVIEKEAVGSLLQHLEDTGYSVPPEEAK